MLARIEALNTVPPTASSRVRIAMLARAIEVIVLLLPVRARRASRAVIEAATALSPAEVALRAIRPVADAVVVLAAAEVPRRAMLERIEALTSRPPAAIALRAILP